MLVFSVVHYAAFLVQIRHDRDKIVRKLAVIIQQGAIPPPPRPDLDEEVVGLLGLPLPSMQLIFQPVCPSPK